MAATIQTYRQLIGALQILNREMGSDRDINNATAMYMIGIFANKYKYTKLAKGSDYGKYLYIDPLMQVHVDATTNRKYFDIPEGILNLPNDGGMNYVSYSILDADIPPAFTGSRFFRTTPTKARTLYFSSYTTPSLYEPYFYISEKKCFLLGLELVNINVVEAGMFIGIDPFNPAKVDIDDVIDDIEIADYILRSSLDMIRYMLLIPKDRMNDGTMVHAADTIPRKFTQEQEAQMAQQQNTEQ